MNEKFISIIQEYPSIAEVFKSVSLSPKGHSLKYKNKAHKLSAGGFKIVGGYDLFSFYLNVWSGAKTVTLIISKFAAIKNKQSYTIVNDEIHDFINFCKSEKVKDLINFL